MRKAISDTVVHRVYTVVEDDLNGYGLMHGGRLLMLADETGFLAARRLVAADCLTVAVHGARFSSPMHLHERLQMQAQVGFCGRTSVWVPVWITVDGRAAMEAVVVYVAVDGERRPMPVPAVAAKTEIERALQQRLQCLRRQVLALGSLRV